MNELQIGERVKRYRESALLSQADLGRLMRERDTKWSQATVWSVETGERPLRVSEAALLADALGFNPAELFTEGSRLDRSEFRRGVEASVRALTALLGERS